jgi:arsenate reductase (thioredoxin)
MAKSRVLFLCTGNSCRSQMAEAIVNDRLGDRWEAHSAGSHPAGYVHPLAVKSLAELGIAHQGRSKSIDEFRGQSFDVVVTLCDQDDEECPVWLGKGKNLHNPFPDPAKVTGNDAEKLAAFREVRDEIIAQLPGLLIR